MKHLLLLLVLLGCSGGGGNADAPRQPPATLRTDLQFVYFGSGGQQLAETVDHITGHMVVPWISPEQQLAEAIAATQAGLQVYVLDVPTQDEQALKQRLEQYRDAGVTITAILHDEPELHGYTDAEIRAGNLRTKRVIQELRMTTKLAVIYSERAFNTWPGIDAYDWVGFDRYGVDIFGNGDYAKLKAALRPDQRIILVPGGVEPWKESVTPFFNVAQNDPQVILLLPFLWIDNADNSNGLGLGIRSNGMASAYKAAGLSIKRGK